jgi:hypothetical protein
MNYTKGIDCGYEKTKGKKLKVLVLYEFSGIVRDEFNKRGHDAWSCDILPSERPGKHFQMPAEQMHIEKGCYDLLIAFPPCTYLTSAGNRWLDRPGRQQERQRAVKDVEWIWSLPVKRKAIENPVGYLSSAFMKPTQIIQPWQFGHGEVKATCLWLSGLKPLVPTKIVSGREARVHRASPGPDRWRERSRTLTGIARAMASQWGK